MTMTVMTTTTRRGERRMMMMEGKRRMMVPSGSSSSNEGGGGGDDGGDGGEEANGGCRVANNGGAAAAGTSLLAFIDGFNNASSLRRRRCIKSSSSASSVVGTPIASIAAASSSSSLSSTSVAADDSFFRNRGGDQSAAQQLPPRPERIPRPDEPNLFEIPSDLHPAYKPVPIVLRAGIALASAAIVGRRSLRQFLLPTATPTSIFRQLFQKLSMALSSQRITAAAVRHALSFALRTALLATVAGLAVQEVGFAPSRVTTRYLAERDELPSALSRYETITPVDPPPIFAKSAASSTTATVSSWTEDKRVPSPPIGVHSIQYKKRDKQSTTPANNASGTPKYDGIYFHHGFGASSLSWLPVLPSLVERLGKPITTTTTTATETEKSNARVAVGVAHDAPGFGFTDRPSTDENGGLEQYGTENNVGIGLALLKNAFRESQDNGGGGGGSTKSLGKSEVEEEGGPKSIAIFGHSMGSKAALLMALTCARHKSSLKFRPALVVLVAPALEGATLPSARASSKTVEGGSKQKNSWFRTMARRVWVAWRKLFLDYPFRYGLRRLVSGSKDFWRKGLTLARGHPDRLSDSDVLRFAWPSIGKGWEEGLINFARAKLSLPALPLDDGQLLREVSNLKDTKVVIVYGSNDRVVRIEGAVAERLRAEFPKVAVVRMEGLGHDPFEEDVDGFLVELEKALVE
mmetsp:Transcript_1409/g.2563  ORF Transcript_1409/g.2563 Transcript_1409/m.2563 type:complete len:691 (-) Transcript_1409:159-2231(-)